MLVTLAGIVMDLSEFELLKAEFPIVSRKLGLANVTV